jgi:hypothetical protein
LLKPASSIFLLLRRFSVFCDFEIIYISLLSTTLMASLLDRYQINRWILCWHIKENYFKINHFRWQPYAPELTLGEQVWNYLYNHKVDHPSSKNAGGRLSFQFYLNRQEDCTAGPTDSVDTNKPFLKLERVYKIWRYLTE